MAQLTIIVLCITVALSEGFFFNCCCNKGRPTVVIVNSSISVNINRRHRHSTSTTTAAPSCSYSDESNVSGWRSNSKKKSPLVFQSNGKSQKLKSTRRKSEKVRSSASPKKLVKESKTLVERITKIDSKLGDFGDMNVGKVKNLHKKS